MFYHFPSMVGNCHFIGESYLVDKLGEKWGKEIVAFYPSVTKCLQWNQDKNFY